MASLDNGTQPQVLAFSLLGDWSASLSGSRTDSLPTGVNGTILATLLLAPHSVWVRRDLGGLVWGSDELEFAVDQRLRTSLTAIRRFLESLTTGGSALLVADARVITLDWEKLRTDVQDFRTAVRKALPESDHSLRGAYLKQALDIYKGDLLPGFTHPAIVQSRQELRSEALHALRLYSESLCALGLAGEAVAEVSRFAEIDPSDAATRSYLAELRAMALENVRNSSVVPANALASKPSAQPEQITALRVPKRLVVVAGMTLAVSAVGWRYWRRDGLSSAQGSSVQFRPLEVHSAVISGSDSHNVKFEFPVAVLPGGGAETSVIVSQRMTSNQDANVHIQVVNDQGKQSGFHSINEDENNAQLPRCVVVDPDSHDMFIGGATCRSHGIHGKELPKHLALWRIGQNFNEPVRETPLICPPEGCDDEVVQLTTSPQTGLFGLLARGRGEKLPGDLYCITDWRTTEHTVPPILVAGNVDLDFRDIALAESEGILVAASHVSKSGRAVRQEAIVHCLNSDGKVNWTKSMSEHLPSDTRANKLLVSSSRVYIGYQEKKRSEPTWTENRARVAALDSATGHVYWDKPLNQVGGWDHLIRDMILLNGQLYVLRTGVFTTVSRVETSDGSYHEVAIAGRPEEPRDDYEATRLLPFRNGTIAVAGSFRGGGKQTRRVVILNPTTLKVLDSAETPFLGDDRQCRACVRPDGVIVVVSPDVSSDGRRVLSASWFR